MKKGMMLCAAEFPWMVTDYKGYDGVRYSDNIKRGMSIHRRFVISGTLR